MYRPIKTAAPAIHNITAQSQMQLKVSQYIISDNKQIKQQLNVCFFKNSVEVSRFRQCLEMRDEIFYQIKSNQIKLFYSAPKS